MGMMVLLKDAFDSDSMAINTDNILTVVPFGGAAHVYTLNQGGGGFASNALDQIEKEANLKLVWITRSDNVRVGINAKHVVQVNNHSSGFTVIVLTGGDPIRCTETVETIARMINEVLL